MDHVCTDKIMRSTICSSSAEKDSAAQLFTQLFVALSLAGDTPSGLSMNFII